MENEITIAGRKYAVKHRYEVGKSGHLIDLGGDATFDLLIHNASEAFGHDVVYKLALFRVEDRKEDDGEE